MIHFYRFCIFFVFFLDIYLDKIEQSDEIFSNWIKSSEIKLLVIYIFRFFVFRFFVDIYLEKNEQSMEVSTNWTKSGEIAL